MERLSRARLATREGLQVRAHKGNWRRGPIRGREYEQVNWDLFDEFASMIAGASSDVAFFQEFPPSWKTKMAEACGADAHRALSGRNWLQPMTSIVGRWRPDLLGAWEGGSNTTLVRPEAGPIVERKPVILTTCPELRAMALTRLESGVSLANFHVSTKPSSAEAELIAAAERALSFAGGGPLVFGGDFNVRPAHSDVLRSARATLRARPPDRAGPPQPPARPRARGRSASRRMAARSSRRHRPANRSEDSALRPPSGRGGIPLRLAPYP